MRLKQWVQLKGRGELTRLQLATGVAYSTIHGLAADRHAARYEVAKRISAATGGAVSIAELCELPAMPAPREQRAKRLKRKRARRAPSALAAPAARA